MPERSSALMRPMGGSDRTCRETLAKAYLQGVITLVRVARVLVLLLLAFFTVSLVIGVGTSETGVIEKVVLLALIAGCVVLAAKVSTFATKTQARLQRH
jgi:ABC-type arginine transport system permease subunit